METPRKVKVGIQRKFLKLNLDKDNIFFILTLIVGVGAAFIAASFSKIIQFTEKWLFKNGDISNESIIYGAIFIFLSGFITTRFAPETSGSGIPGVQISYVAHHGVIKFKSWLLKWISTLLTLSAGFSVGREGPTIYTAAGLGSSIGSLFSLSKTQIKGLFAVGASGGIAAAFNTPIAAVLFTLEEIIGNMKMHFYPIL